MTRLNRESLLSEKALNQWMSVISFSKVDFIIDGFSSFLLTRKPHLCANADLFFESWSKRRSKTYSKPHKTAQTVNFILHILKYVNSFGYTNSSVKRRKNSLCSRFVRQSLRPKEK